MAIKVGTDIVEIERFSKVIERRPGLRTKLFSPSELAYCDIKANPNQHLAARFCAKEAFAKAIGTGIRSFAMRDVEVSVDQIGKPFLKLSEKAFKVAYDLGIRDMDVSLSHSKDLAMAVVVVDCVWDEK